MSPYTVSVHLVSTSSVHDYLLLRPIIHALNSLDQVQALFLNDVGEPLDNLFTDFDPNPIGVASLAQVHIAVDKLTGKKVAVKLMHPDLQEFTRLDMTTT